MFLEHVSKQALGSYVPSTHITTCKHGGVICHTYHLTDTENPFLNSAINSIIINQLGSYIFYIDYRLFCHNALYLQCTCTFIGHSIVNILLYLL